MWNDWKDDSSCSKSCGFGAESGTKSQIRTKKKEKQYGGHCDDVYKRNVSCTTKNYCPGK